METVRKLSTRMADGREILWFDGPGHPPRDPADLVDRRDLPAVTPASQLRYDALAGEWVTIAAHRQDRTYQPPADQCPLCPSRDGRLTEIPAPGYEVVAFENRFPSFGSAPGAPPPETGPDAPVAAAGRCEVVCFTDDHATPFSRLPPERVRLVLEAWADRTADLGARPGVRYVFPFENRGAEIGVTLSHPHGQIYAYPYVPPFPQRMLAHVAAHRAATGENLFDVALAAERAGERVVVAGEHWTAFVPEAARWPVEVHLYPHRPTPDLPALDEEQRAEFPRIYLDVLRRLDALYDDELPYVAGWNQAPVRESDGRADARLHLRLHSIRRAPGKIKYLAGSESGAGAFISDVLPEAVAARLRGL
ncbi:UDPglucose--hexose-1-phosphate uridylyltransferase [Pseudonocardia parietis]|uniref:Galactose-1-phosphate uridylyltransferase n=1 Tax=Pseudonocardia parietis TaxID=570936 RepID=A0ABS4W002_9PSEU|nr:galactose-1-phosphate uridylyltransferase [Pseudonocardia parietis]MBP2369423.1 UDPglucose--hexose-1-phosphate uridylyltransferase [Pseudonocardia parietis]